MALVFRPLAPGPLEQGATILGNKVRVDVGIIPLSVIEVCWPIHIGFSPQTSKLTIRTICFPARHHGRLTPLVLPFAGTVYWPFNMFGNLVTAHGESRPQPPPE